MDKSPEPMVKISVIFSNHEEMKEDDDYEEYIEMLKGTTTDLATLYATVLANPDRLMDLFVRFTTTFTEMCEEEIHDKEPRTGDPGE